MVPAIDDRVGLPADRIGLCAKCPTLSESGVWTALCSSSSLNHCSLLGVFARIPSGGWLPYCACRGLQNLSNPVLCLLYPKKELARTNLGSNYRCGNASYFYSGLRMERSSDVSARGPSVGSSWRRSAALSGGGFTLRRAALPLSLRTSVEPAAMALLPAVLRAAPVHRPGAGNDTRDPAHPQKRQYAGTHAVGMVGIVDRGPGSLHNSRLVQLPTVGISHLCSCGGIVAA